MSFLFYFFLQLLLKFYFFAFWFIEKDDKNGISDLYPLSDFSVRKTENVERGYMLGRYGAVPFIKNDFNLWEEE